MYVGETNCFSACHSLLFSFLHLYCQRTDLTPRRMLVTNNVSGFHLSPLLSKDRQSHTVHAHKPIHTQTHTIITPNTDAFQELRKALFSAAICAFFLGYNLRISTNYIMMFSLTTC